MKALPGLRMALITAGLIAVGSAIVNLPSLRISGPSNLVVRADGGACSVASLSGPYAVSRQGTLLASVLGLPAPAPWDEVARADFDGAGSFTGSATVNIGGVVLNSVPFTGTYMINSDCTGTITVHPNVPVTITESIIVISGGRQYFATDTESFAVVQGTAQRLGE
jgi:hypothetical protein